MELVRLYGVVIRLGAAKVRLHPDSNRWFPAARGLCAAMGALGFEKLQRNAVITAQGFVTR
jgi:hypothetical protein